MSDQSIIYQFGEPSGSVCVLKNLTLKVTPPMEFNDPFEFTPRMNHEFDSAIISEANIASAEAISGPPPADVEAIRASIRAYPPEEFRNAFAPHFAELCRKAVREYSQKVTDGFGVICFSHSRQSILMWSRYASKHSGIAIGFDGSHGIFSPLLKVSYRPDRLLFDPTQSVGGQYDEGFASELIRSKHEYWSYEEEARVMVRLSDLDPPTVGGQELRVRRHFLTANSGSRLGRLDTPLVTKLQLGHALVLEALLPGARTRMSARDLSTPTKQSFGNKCVPKPELGNEKVREKLGRL